MGVSIFYMVFPRHSKLVYFPMAWADNKFPSAVVCRLWSTAHQSRAEQQQQPRQQQRSRVSDRHTHTIAANRPWEHYGNKKLKELTWNISDQSTLISPLINLINSWLNVKITIGQQIVRKSFPFSSFEYHFQGIHRSWFTLYPCHFH